MKSGIPLLLIVICLAIFSPAIFGEKRDPGGVASIPDLPKETEVVAEFYRLLLQDDEPTLEQEQALIADSGLRGNLVEAQGQDATKPLILRLSRQHKSLFLPDNYPEERLLASITLSSPFKFPRTLNSQRDDDTKYVMATFLTDWKNRPGHTRTIVFQITEDNRIDPEGILLDGFGSDLDMIFAHRFSRWPDGE
jgi:hypothetical protein